MFYHRKTILRIIFIEILLHFTVEFLLLKDLNLAGSLISKGNFVGIEPYVSKTILACLPLKRTLNFEFP